VTTFGTLSLPQPRGRLPARATLGAFRHVSAHAEAITFLALAGLGAVGVLLAVVTSLNVGLEYPMGPGG
jgi:hypothetical protein